MHGDEEMNNDDDDVDFQKPGPVGRDPLTEGWKPANNGKEQGGNNDE